MMREPRSPPAAHHLELDPRSMWSAVSSRCMSSTPRTGSSSIATTRSSARRPAEAAGEAGDHLDHLDAALATERAATRGGNGRAPPAMPIQARRTRPSRISAEMTRGSSR